MIELDRRSCAIEFWDNHFSQQIEVGNEFVPVFTHLVAVILESSGGHVEVLQQLPLKLELIRNDPHPMVIGPFVAEELAPFQHYLIEKISVHRYPKISIW